MSDESHEETGERRQSRPRWIEDMQAALDRTGSAVRTAWTSTREERVAALEAAKQAARELGEMLEKGIETARERWDTESAAGEPAGTEGTPTATETPTPSDAPPPGPGGATEQGDEESDRP